MTPHPKIPIKVCTLPTCVIVVVLTVIVVLVLSASTVREPVTDFTDSNLLAIVTGEVAEVFVRAVRAVSHSVTDESSVDTRLVIASPLQTRVAQRTFALGSGR